MDLGCDPQGYSRAGNETTIWYCVILAGRQSPELHKMREVSLLPFLCIEGPYVMSCIVVFG